MKLRTQFLTILLLVFGSLCILLFLGRQRLSEAVADTEQIVDHQFNPLVFENAPRLQETYEGLTGLLNTIRDANQARIAQIKSTYLSRSHDEIQRLSSDARRSLQNMESTLQILSKTLPVALKTDWESHQQTINNWIQEERQIIQLTEELSEQISQRAHYHELAEQSFIPFRASIDTLGERADQQLLAPDPSAKVADLGKAVSLILNADRDSFQARMAAQRIVLHVETDTQRYHRTRAEYEDNMEQIVQRLSQAQTLLGNSENIGFAVVNDLYRKWAQHSAAAVAISDQILDKLRLRERRIHDANLLFAQSQDWLSKAHARLKSIAVQEFAAFETARTEALSTSDNIRNRARSYLTLFNFLAILAFLCFLVLLVFQRRLVRNLIGLSTYLSELDEKKLSTPYRTPPQRILPSLELTQLADNLNAMRGRLVDIIQAHKDALTRLSRSETRFSSLFYNSVSPTLLANPQTGKIVDANQAAAELYQVSIEQLRESELAQFDAASASSQHTIAQSIKQLPATHSLQFGSLQRRSDQSTFDAQVYAGTVEIDAAPHALILINDISKRVEFEQQLLKAKEAAEASSRAKDEFLSVMSHELRTPLNPIIGYAQLLESSSSPESDANEFAQGILTGANHMLGVVDRILQFTHLSQDESPATPQIFTLDTLLQESRDYARLNAQGGQVTFQNGSDTLQAIFPSATLKGPKLNLTQILLNLLENALKYAEGSPIKITTGLTQSAKACTLHLIVEDQGPGVPETFRKALFSPFTQADSSFTRQHEGLGLGLAICHKLATQADGDIAYEPNSPKGSRFTATFPVTLTQTLPLAENAPSQADASSRPASLPQTQILLVEDNPENARYLTYVLDQMGCHVDFADNGPQAIEKAQQKRYHAALIDISLKGMDGLEILDRLNQIPTFKEATKSIAVTAHASNSLRDTCLSHGFHDFLTKPVSAQLLGNTIQRHLAH
ncbi:response regulator [Pelagicoccus sp. SDUM812005]|uniref:hybrid sensor histidine kinase/response regulator n=1 Tax=Pelagicoccus sp. SDUM812005 TaxID=3041257 RepID=UPI0028108C89|nr:response regulator [Pelagicoccus sp. SDUM812005]MDQ8181244.1 response regulator [Pelagicoccus sp. SDUM812005]